jgi:hypothetical protein
MKTLKNTKLFFFFILLTSLVIGSCNKKKDTTAKIYIYNQFNSPISGAEVVMYGEPSEQGGGTVVVYDTAVSNSEGFALFNYNDVYQQGQAGVAVLNIKATKGTEQGTGVIKIEEEVENTAKVFIQ